MVLVHKTYSGVRSVLHKFGSAFLVVAGFFLVFFTASTPNFGADRIGGQTVAHADATSCTSCTTCGKGGDTGDGGDGERGDGACSCGPGVGDGSACGGCAGGCGVGCAGCLGCGSHF